MATAGAEVLQSALARRIDTSGDRYKAAAAGITGGAASGGYEPVEPFPRGQMASFLARSLDLLVRGLPVTADPFILLLIGIGMFVLAAFHKLKMITQHTASWHPISLSLRLDQRQHSIVISGPGHVRVAPDARPPFDRRTDASWRSAW